jgi:hypothetical protein
MHACMHQSLFSQGRPRRDCTSNLHAELHRLQFAPAPVAGQVRHNADPSIYHAHRGCVVRALVLLPGVGIGLSVTILVLLLSTKQSTSGRRRHHLSISEIVTSIKKHQSVASMLR